MRPIDFVTNHSSFRVFMIVALVVVSGLILERRVRGVEVVA